MNALVVTGNSIGKAFGPAFAGALVTFSFSSISFPAVRFHSCLVDGTIDGASCGTSNTTATESNVQRGVTANVSGASNKSFWQLSMEKIESVVPNRIVPQFDFLLCHLNHFYWNPGCVHGRSISAAKPAAQYL